MWPKEVLGLVEIIDATSGVDVLLDPKPAVRVSGTVDVTPGPKDHVLDIPSGEGPQGPDGIQGPVGSQGATGAAGMAQAIGVHDTTYSPVGLWQFNGNLNDSSGNGFNLTADAGTPLFGQLAPGLPGVFLSSTRLKAAASANALRITGDVTVELLAMLLADNTGAMPTSAPLVSFTGGQDDTTSTLNYLYQLAFDPGRLLYWFHEHGTGVNDTYQLTSLALPPLRQLFHLAATRTANVVQFYVNGRAFGPPSSALTAPTDASLSQLWVGGQGGTIPTLAPDCALASLKIVAGALTAAQVKAEFNRTAGKFYGYVP